MIEMKHLNIEFNNKIIFNNAFFKADCGQITGIIGASGCGKTTFLNALLYKYQSQILDVDGIEINHNNKQDYLLSKVSYIDQFGSFFDNMKIIEHFQLISHITQQTFDRSKMNEMFHLMGLDSIEPNSYPSILSIGQRKRFLMALALYKNSSIIIMDEPTASLDEETKKDIFFILQELKKQNKYIILTSHDDELIKQCDVIYTIENYILKCSQELNCHKEKNEIKEYNQKKNWKYFLYKNTRQWFQLILVSILGIIMTLSISVNVCDSFFQEEALSAGIERANKAEIYLGKRCDAYKNDNIFISSDQEDNLPLTNEQINQISQIKHINGIYPFDTINTINQESDIQKAKIQVEDKEIELDYLTENTPLIVPYYEFQHIQFQDKEITGNAITESFASKLGIDTNMKNFTITLTAFVPVQQYLYTGSPRVIHDDGSDDYIECEMCDMLVKQVQLQFVINHIITTDEYYNEFLTQCYPILIPADNFYQIMNKYRGQEADETGYASYYQAKIVPYQTKNYILDVDRVKNIKEVEKDILKISPNFVVYDQYNSVLDTADIYKEERKDRFIFIIMVILVAIILYWIVLMNFLDDRKNEIKLLNIYGLHQKDIIFLLNQNIVFQSVLCIILAIPIFYFSRKLGFFVVIDMASSSAIIIYFLTNMTVIMIVFIFYTLYCRHLIKKVIK